MKREYGEVPLYIQVRSETNSRQGPFWDHFLRRVVLCETKKRRNRLRSRVPPNQEEYRTEEGSEIPPNFRLDLTQFYVKNNFVYIVNFVNK